jgi:hypothetical protein
MRKVQKNSEVYIIVKLRIFNRKLFLHPVKAAAERDTTLKPFSSISVKSGDGNPRTNVNRFDGNFFKYRSEFPVLS